MASAVGKTPPKPVKDSKEGTPVKNESSDSSSKNQTSDNSNKNDKPGQNRENRFQNRRGGRSNFQNRGNRGGFQGRDGGHHRDTGGGGGNFNSGSVNPPSADFTGEQNDGPKEQKKFTGRCRLFVGNITPDTTEEQFKEMFTPFGEVSELFVNAARGFGFIRLDYRINAEKAKIELDGQMRNNRVLRVRFATHGAALKVYNLSSFVSNELLEKAFSQFGEVERAVVCVDDRGRSCGEGLVEFARKPGAQAAFKRINEGVFLLSSYPRPVRVEMLEQRDEEDGLTEKFVQRNDGFRQDREKEPRFANPGSFEYEFGLKHRQIDDMEKERIERVKKDMEQERQRLAEEMETAIFDFQADQIRQDLLRQQEELKRLDELKNEHMRRRQEMDLRRRDLQGGDSMMRQQQDERREMMMRASNAMNREREGNMSQGSNRGPGGRPDDMMRGPVGMMDSQGGRSGDHRGGPNTPPMPMAPPPVPPGMGMDQNRPPQGMEGGPSRFGDMHGSSPGGNRQPMDRPPMDRPPMDRSPMDRPPMDRPPMDRALNMDRPPHGNMKEGPPPNMPRGGPGGPPPGRFPGPGGPPGGQNNFPQGPGGPMPNRFPPNMPPGGHMGPRGGDRRDQPRRDDFEAKRMRRF